MITISVRKQIHSRGSKVSIVSHPGSKFLYMSFQVDGKKVFKSTKTANKAIARQIEAKERERIVKEKMLGRDLEIITFGDALEKFIDSKAGTPRGKQLQTIVNPLKGLKRDNKTKQQVKVYGIDFGIPIHLLKSSDINRLIEARRKEGSAEATIRQHVIAIASTLKWAKQMGYLVDQATTAPTIRMAKKQPIFLTADEERSLLESLDPTAARAGYGNFGTRPEKRQQRLQDQYDFVTCLLDTGGRYHEVTHLEWKDVDLANGLMYVRQHKVDKAHTVYMSDRIKEVLTTRVANKSHETWVFPNDERNSHRPYHTGWFLRAVERAGIEKKIRFHKLRSTYACKLVQNGASLYEVQTLLGHSDSATTQIYASLIATDVSKKAADMLNKIQARV